MVKDITAVSSYLTFSIAYMSGGSKENPAKPLSFDRSDDILKK